MKKFLASVALSILLPIALTACGNSKQVATKSYVAGNGAVTVIKAENRKSAPILSGKTLDGVDLKVETGKVSVVNVWASWCAPCRAEAPILAALSQKYPETNFLGILTRDSEVAARAFQKRFALPFPTLIDDSILVGFRGTLSANAIPTTLVIDKNGRVAARISGAVTVASLSNLIEKISAE